MNPENSSVPRTQPLAVAFVAAILPDSELPNYPAASIPGNRFQHGVLSALLTAGINTNVISLRPVSSYPQSRKLIFRGVDGTLCGIVPYRQIGFINAGLIKTVTAAISCFFVI